MNTTQRLVLAEVALAMLLASGALWLIDLLTPWLPGLVGLLCALAFGVVPLLVLRLGNRRGLEPLADPLGIDRAPVWRGIAVGIVASVVVLPLFAIGLDLLQVHVLRHRRLGPSAIASAGVGFQGRAGNLQGRVALLDDRQGTAVENHTARAIRLQPACTDPDLCRARTVPSGGRVLLPPAAAADLAIAAEDGQPLPAGTVVAGGSGEALDLPVHAAAGYGWLLTWLLSQWLVIALPEEMFFRGYVLRRLSQAFVPRRRVLGVPFGAAHVLSSLLFAVIHLVLVPSPVRLLVFFPGLLFAWLAQRTRGVFAPATHHALANVCQAALLLLYAPK